MSIEKIEINGHYVWVDKDAEIKENTNTINQGLNGDWFWNSKYDAIARIGDITRFDFKIIAASPELGLEGIPTYVEWLAKEEVGWWDKNDDQDAMNFIKGYQTAEKELYTEDDVRKAIEMAQKTNWRDRHTYSEKEIIEQVKQEKK
jgi:hypothetical protein